MKPYLLQIGLLLLSIGIGRTEEKKTPFEEALAREPVPKSYSIITLTGEEESYNYSTNLGEHSFHGLDLRVWMIPNKVVLTPDDDLEITVYFENISKRDIWVPDPIDWHVNAYATIESGATSSNLAMMDPHDEPKKIPPGHRGKFTIKLETPIDDNGFLCVQLNWGTLESISPNPVTVEGRAQNASNKPEEASRD